MDEFHQAPAIALDLLIKQEAAKEFIAWLIFEPGQEAIGRFRLAGQPLFIPDRPQH